MTPDMAADIHAHDDEIGDQVADELDSVKSIPGFPDCVSATSDFPISSSRARTKSVVSVAISPTR